MKTPWYVYIFGGKKAYLGFLAGVCGMWMWLSLDMAGRKSSVSLFLAFFVACFITYSFFNIREKQVKNGNGEPK